jgi:hypothetical protein
VVGRGRNPRRSGLGGWYDVHRPPYDRVRAPSSLTFEAVSRIGGDNGYYALDWLWVLRGVLDRLFGGPGLRRGRRDPRHIAYGDTIDFWRVAEFVPDRRLCLRAEMRLPGEALLEFEVEKSVEGRSRLTQTARFQARGLVGILYWYAVLPLHRFVFEGMLRGIRRAAEVRTGPGPAGGDRDPARNVQPIIISIEVATIQLPATLTATRLQGARRESTKAETRVPHSASHASALARNPTPASATAAPARRRATRPHGQR